MVKYKLGLFEAPFVDPGYAEKVVHSEEHKKLALEAAQEGIVLLKNENKILPLNKKHKINCCRRSACRYRRGPDR